MTDTVIDEGVHDFLDVGNTRVHIQRIGTREETLVMIHGGGPGASSWTNFMGNVLALSEHFSLLLVDLPGYGKSGPARQPEEQPSAFQYYASCVAEVLDHLGIVRAHFLGNSLGGGVSFRFAHAYPERTGRLVLLGPAGVCYPVWSPSGRIHSHLGEVSGSLLRNPSPETMRAFLEEMVYDKSMVVEEQVTERLADLLELIDEPKPGSPIFEMWLDTQDRVVRFNPDDFESWRMCGAVEAETLLIWGRDDHFNPVDGALYPLQYMPHAELQVFGRCGHWAQVEQQDRFNDAAIEFLTRTAA
ncbi:alpha/beta fold hydrolase [Nocardia sp. NPDC050799]|uniref:alpha/beta fold hydrolase n=1 Tax=Nocardia sp. NPDC050799 TaxID=3154842 RepID=UPI0033EA71A9